jgi:uncharacterized protein (DUF2345 family)
MGAQSGSAGKPATKGAGRAKDRGTSGAATMPRSPAALEQAIVERRNHLSATIDELTFRARPKQIARRGVAGVRAKVQNATHTPEGELRTERLAAVGGAVVLLTGVLVFLRRRRA